MRTKIVIERGLDIIDSKLRNLNFHIGRNERKESYTAIDDIKQKLSEIRTFLNTESQD